MSRLRTACCIAVASLLASCGASSERSNEGDPTASGAGTVCTACDGVCEEAVEVHSALHIDGDLGYGDPPPASGDHNDCWAPWGVHTDELRPENWVHNLEHGGVVLLTHCPDGCDADIATLSSFATGKSQVLVSPYSRMSARFAAIAWGHRLLSSCLDMNAVAAFTAAHIDRAPESIASGPPSGCP
jgi:hypothetical protein